MIDININAIISQALAAAVQQATAPLLERIAALEAQSANRHERLRVLEGALTDRVTALEDQALVVSDAVDKRIAALENNPAQGVDTTLEQAAVNKDAHERQLFVLQHLTARVTALENNPAQGVDTTLNAWEMAMQNRVDSADAVAKRLHERVTALEKHTAVLDQHGGIVEYLDNQEWFWDKLRRFTDTAVEQAIENHTDCWDHNDFVTEDKLDDYVQKDSFRDEIEDVLNNATIRIRF